MSLVAYESSGEESEGEETGKVEESHGSTAVGPKPLVNDKNRPTEANRLQNEIGSVGDVRSRNKTTPGHAVSLDGDWGTHVPGANQENKRPSRSLFSFLPPPSKNESGILIEEEADPIVSKRIVKANGEQKAINESMKAEVLKEQQNEIKKGGKLSLPKPKGNAGDGKQRVKITLKNLPEADSDSDEEEVKTAKKNTVGKNGSGLLASLPQPKFSASASKGAAPKGNERKPSKLYVPYTLSKKKEEDRKDRKPEGKGDESGSDDEESSSGFFSFGETSQKDLNDSALISLESNRTLNAARKKDELLSKAKIGKVDREPATQIDNVPESCKNPPMEQDGSVNKNYKNSIISRTARTFEPTNERERDKTSANSGAVTNVSPVTGPYGTSTSQIHSQSSAFPNDNVTGPYESQSNPYIGTHSDTQGGFYSGSYDPYSGTNSFDQANVVDQFGSKAYLNPEPNNQYNPYANQEYAVQAAEPQESIDPDQLRRLQGKRERRLQEIDIIDIHGEQMKCDASMLLKNITEEKTHVPKRSKTDMPSSQQKRKHQITYLAFQAKERENELRKSWATNAQTKRQTQQKYGF